MQFFEYFQPPNTKLEEAGFETMIISNAKKTKKNQMKLSE